MQAVDSDRLWPAFNNPVAQSQQAFRLILKAMSEPGVPVIFDDEQFTLSNGQPFTVYSGIVAGASYVLALTLLDQDVKVWLSPDMERSAFSENVRFHCGCQIVTDSESADFAWMSVDEWSTSSAYKMGSNENPHQSATLVIQCGNVIQCVDDWQALAAGRPGMTDALTLKLSGPGIKHTREIMVPELTVAHLQLLQANHQLYPLGKDILLTSNNSLVALPRSTRVELADKPQGLTSAQVG